MQMQIDIPKHIHMFMVRDRQMGKGWPSCARRREKPNTRLPLSSVRVKVNDSECIVMRETSSTSGKQNSAIAFAAEDSASRKANRRAGEGAPSESSASYLEWV